MQCSDLSSRFWVPHSHGAGKFYIILAEWDCKKYSALIVSFQLQGTYDKCMINLRPEVLYHWPESDERFRMIFQKLRALQYSAFKGLNICICRATSFKIFIIITWLVRGGILCSASGLRLTKPWNKLKLETVWTCCLWTLSKSVLSHSFLATAALLRHSHQIKWRWVTRCIWDESCNPTLLIWCFKPSCKCEDLLNLAGVDALACLKQRQAHQSWMLSIEMATHNNLMCLSAPLPKPDAALDNHWDLDVLNLSIILGNFKLTTLLVISDMCSHRFLVAFLFPS